MTAKSLCELCQDVIGMSFDSDQSKMLFLCRMANHEIWKQGKWNGFIKEFHVNTKRDSDGNIYFIAPPTHNILLGVNIASQPTRITNSWFQFHRNGGGSISKENGWNYTESVMSMDESPVLEQPRKRNLFDTKCSDPVYIAVRSRGIEASDATIIVSGENRTGETNYSFTTAQANSHTRTIASPEFTNFVSLSPTYGAELPITDRFSLCDNLAWSRITSITKKPTNSPVDVYAVHDNGESYLLATLAPHQTESKYRKYHIPKECVQHTAIHGLFKSSEPSGIVNPSMMMVTDNVTALMDMMIGMNYKYFKTDLTTAAVYILSAVRALEDSTRENMANSQTAIQVDETIYGIPNGYLDNNY